MDIQVSLQTGSGSRLFKSYGKWKCRRYFERYASGWNEDMARIKTKETWSNNIWVRAECKPDGTINIWTQGHYPYEAEAIDGYLKKLISEFRGLFPAAMSRVILPFKGKYVPLMDKLGVREIIAFSRTGHSVLDFYLHRPKDGDFIKLSYQTTGKCRRIISKDDMSHGVHYPIIFDLILLQALSTYIPKSDLQQMISTKRSMRISTITW